LNKLNQRKPNCETDIYNSFSFKKTVKRLLSFTLLLFVFQNATAGHIAGGEVYYTWLRAGNAPNSDVYRITLRLFRDCAAAGASLAEMPANATVAIFNNETKRLTEINPPLTQRSSFRTITLSNPSPCILNPQPVCYQVGEYSFEKELPRSSQGYTVSFQTCCRSSDIVNVTKFPIPGGVGGNGEGATYTANIPGADVLTAAEHNSSPVFSLKDTALVCADKTIMLDFSASDADGDSLSYSFCSAYNRGNALAAVENYVSTAPPYAAVTYEFPFSGTRPIGNKVNIDPTTGIISGVAPSSGVYVVNVCISEWRNGKQISTHRKDFSLKIASCDFAAAQLPIQQITCDGFTVQFENESTSSLIKSYNWDFGVNGISSDTSTQPVPTYTYTDTGTYIAKLIVNKGDACSDSATTLVKVYPGFFPDFEYDSTCVTNPFVFRSTSTTRYGSINYTRWNFGDASVRSDTSLLRAAQYKYPDTGAYTVQLIAASDKGCRDTVTKTIQVFEKPALSVAFSDTLICSIDSLQLHAIGKGVFSWTPTTNMLNANTANPIVWPKDTTTYSVTVTDLGCTATQKVTVNTLDFITVNAGPDTTICRTDGVQLRPITHALGFLWSPSTTLDNPRSRNPIAKPTDASTTYTVLANLGKCQATDQITVTTVPYPISNAGVDTVICFQDTAILRGSMVGKTFQWTPTSILRTPNTLTTVAFPLQTTSFVLAVYDDLGCPKPGLDTVLVTVRPPIQVFAGNDTTVVIGQPLQLNGVSNAQNFHWSPPTWLNNTNIADPIANFSSLPNGGVFKYVLTASTPEGCNNTDEMLIRVFTTLPSIFLPSGFTPNNDGKNDTYKPILAGMRQLDYFRIYNRYGALVFETKTPGRGWDGKIKGQLQSTGGYVYSCQAVDFTGKVVKQNGSFMLIR
jgi:gliding motility-associated-like protein